MEQQDRIAEYNLSSVFTTRLGVSTLEQIASRLRGFEGLLIFDKRVFELYAKLLKVSESNRLLQLRAGEKHKNLQSVLRIYDFLQFNRASRDTEVIIFGGGTITDVAAFAVSTYNRGCRLSLVPTTLLGMVDASLGGKTAVNYKGIKNQAGTFYPAANVIISEEFLQTINREQLRNGMAEMLKIWHIVPTLDFSETGLDNAIVTDAILPFSKAKLEICSRDPLDLGERRLLNLGHTFGHIIEAASNCKISHGKAVALGTVLAARFSQRLGFIDKETVKAIENNFNCFKFPTRLDEKTRNAFLSSFLEIASRDKKSAQGGLVLILFKGYRDVFIAYPMSLEDVLKVIPECI